MPGDRKMDRSHRQEDGQVTQSEIWTGNRHAERGTGRWIVKVTYRQKDGQVDIQTERLTGNIHTER